MKKTIDQIVSCIMAVALSASCLHSTFNRCPDIHAADTFLGTEVYELPDYPLRVQSGPTCWAATIASMAEYINGRRYMNEEIIARYIAVTGNQFNGGININEALEVIKDVISSHTPQLQNSFMAPFWIRYTLSRNRPSYIRGNMYDSDGNLTGAHAVALVGYSEVQFESGNNIIVSFRYMNSQNGEILYSSYSSDGNNYFRNKRQDLYYLWDGSIFFVM